MTDLELLKRVNHLCNRAVVLMDDLVGLRRELVARMPEAGAQLPDLWEGSNDFERDVEGNLVRIYPEGYPPLR